MPNYDTALLVKVAEMYFYQGISQKEIGQKLSISPATVSRLLQAGYESNVIKVEISDVGVSQDDTADRIKEKYGLESVVIVDTPNPCDEQSLKKYIGQRAKHVLLSLLTPDCNVGVGVGATIWEMISSFRQNEIPYSINVISMMGGWSDSTSLDAESFSILYKMAQTLGCSCKALLTPSVVKSREATLALLEEPEIQKVTSLWPKLDIAVFGIGPGIRHSSHRDIYGEDIDELTGDICGWPLSKDGEVMAEGLKHHLMAIPPVLLKKASIRMGIGGGMTKCANTVSALRGGFITHLVTDSETARYIRQTEIGD